MMHGQNHIKKGKLLFYIQMYCGSIVFFASKIT